MNKTTNRIAYYKYCLFIFIIISALNFQCKSNTSNNTVLLDNNIDTSSYLDTLIQNHCVKVYFIADTGLIEIDKYSYKQLLICDKNELPITVLNKNKSTYTKIANIDSLIIIGFINYPKSSEVSLIVYKLNEIEKPIFYNHNSKRGDTSFTIFSISMDAFISANNKSIYLISEIDSVDKNTNEINEYYEVNRDTFPELTMKRNIILKKHDEYLNSSSESLFYANIVKMTQTKLEK